MWVKIDDIILDQSVVEIGSIRRRSEEKCAPGVNGSVSVDMGSTERRIVQKGFLRCHSIKKLEEQKSLLNSLINGQRHTLIVDEKVYENIRVDSFVCNTARGPYCR